MKKHRGKLFSKAYSEYCKLYIRLEKSLLSGKYWDYDARKRKSLFKRLKRYERQLDRRSISWKRLTVPAVSSLMLLATRGVKAEIHSGDEERKENASFKLEAISNNTVDAYAPIGTIVGTISGGAGPGYVLPAGLGDNHLFTILNGEILVVNDEIWKTGKTSLTVEINDSGGSPLPTETITVTGLPVNTFTGQIAFKDSGQPFPNQRSIEGRSADMDLDGDLDIIVLQDTAFTVYYNNGSGLFDTYNTVAAGNRFYTNAGFEIGDVDGDGDPDVFIASNFGLGTSDLAPYPLFINNIGSFTSSYFPYTSFYGGDVQIGDLDGDGDMDLVTNGSFPGNDVWRNDGGGSISSYNFYTGFGGQYILNDLSDLDNDGDLDLISSGSGTTRGYNGYGAILTGTDVFESNFIIDYRSSDGAATFDVDGDDDLDIIFSGYFPSGNSMFTNDGTGSFSGISNDFGAYSYAKIPADFDGDGNLDVLSKVDDYYNNETVWKLYTNDGSGVFTAVEESVIDLQGFGNYFTPVVGDFDGDGDMDVFAATNGQNYLLLNTENNPVSSVTLSNNTVSRLAPKGSVVGQLDATDPDGDSLKFALLPDTVQGPDNAYFTIRRSTNELVTNQEFSNTAQSSFDLWVGVTDGYGSYDTTQVIVNLENPLIATPGSTFSPQPFNPNSSTFEGTKFVDIDKDGDLDLLAGRNGSNYSEIIQFTNDGTGSFASSDTLYTYFSYYAKDVIDAADIDQDGDVDILASASNTTINYPNLFVNLGGTFDPDTINGDFRAAELADLNGDGDFDLIAATPYDIDLFNNFNNYFFSQGYNLDGFTNNSFRSFDLADLDADGDLDIGHASQDGFGNSQLNVDELGEFYGESSSYIGIASSLISNLGSKDHEFGDLNNDGAPDVITPDSIWIQDPVTNQFNNQGINLNTSLALGLVTTATIDVGDLDGDGDLDAIIGDGYGVFARIDNNGTGSFTDSGFRINPGNLTNPYLDIQDLDSDGDLDLFLRSDGAVDSIFFNTSPLSLVTNAGISGQLGQSTTITSAELLTTDIDTPPNQIIFTVDTLPAAGTVDLSGVPLAAGETFTQADINNSLVAYTHDGSATLTDEFFFSVSDGSTDIIEQLFAVSIEAGPVLSTNIGATLDEGDSLVIDGNNLAYTDGNNTAAELVYTVTSTPTSVQIENVNNPGVAITTFTQSSLNLAKIVLKHDGSENTLDSFDYEISDGTNPAETGSFEITINPINDEPQVNVLSDLTVSFNADSTIRNTNFELIDPDNPATDVVVNLLSSSSVGQVELSTNPGVPINSFTKTDLDNDVVVFSHLGISNAATDSLEFEVTDGTATTAVQTLTIIVNNVAQPTIVNNTGATVPQGQEVSITDAKLLTDDPDTPIGDLVYVVTTPPLSGQLEDPAFPGLALTSFTQEDLNAGNVQYVHDNSLVLTDQFGFTVSDNATTLPETTFTIDVIKDQLRSDSTMLVNIYETTNGVEWTNQAGWLTDPVNTWDGVTVTGSSVTGLDLASNGLEGVMDLSGDGLDSLQTLDVSNNKLSALLGTVEKVDLSTVNVRVNSMDFDAVAALLAGSYTLTYDSMNALLPVVDTLVQIGDDVVVDRTVGGGVNYSWFKDGEAISQTGPSFTLSAVDFPEDGEYYAEVTNTAAPGLTITTNPFFLKVSSRERDSTSLLIVYRELGLIGETEEPPYPYQGVTLANNRAQSIDISGLGASDTLSEAIRDVESLESLDISNNEITVLPDLTGSLPNLIEFKISENLIQFTDIEKNFNFNENEQVIDYLGGMKSFDLGADSVTFQQGTPFDLSFTFEGNNVSYAWEFVPYRETEAQSVGQESTYAVDSIKRSDMGTYRLLATDSGVPGLELQTDSTLVLAFAQLTGTVETPSGSGLPSGLMDVFEIDPTSETGYPLKDSLVAVTDGTFTVPNLILGDYICLTFDPSDEFLPTYFGNTIDWDEADDTGIIVINQDTEVSNYVMLSALGDIPANEENGELDMLVETNFDEDGEQDSRIERRRRARRAACFLSRRTRAGGGRLDQSGEFELIAFQETDDNGNVSFGNLPEGEYRINIQFPGIPMEDSEQVEFVIEPGEEGSQFSANAEITEDGISVEVEKILGIIRKYFRDLSIYPNPANENFTLKYGRLLAENVRMKMISLSGSTLRDIEVEKGYDQEITVDTKNVEEGVYVLYFYDAENADEIVYSFKVIVKH